MNILFLMKLMHIGGQEMVTITLANYFASKGHNVSIVCFEEPWKEAVERTHSDVRFYTLGTFEYSRLNVRRLNEILSKEKTDVVVNQWGLPYIPSKVLDAALKLGGTFNPNIKKIAIYHNDPLTNARIKDVEIALDGCKNPLKRSLLKLKKCLFKKVTSRSMRYVYEHCDQYQVLSPNYIENFKQFTGIPKLDRIVFQANPLTIDSDGFIYTLEKKQKEIIYCGRIDFNQKRVYRLIDVWSFLEPLFPDWRLTIVGDGEARKDVEDRVETLKLQRVCFEGFQKPIEYYKRASILVLTSEYEGFPLVLAECMNFGVVPCVYDSFAALRDILEDGKNGVVVEKVNGTFSAKKMAEKLGPIMNDDAKRNKMANAAIERSKLYSVENIYQQWIANLETLQHKND